MRTHLALRSNPGCRIRCEGEDRAWTPGRCLAFEPESIHEAVNEGREDRVVLLVDVDVRHAFDPVEACA